MERVNRVEQPSRLSRAASRRVPSRKPIGLVSVRIAHETLPAGSKNEPAGRLAKRHRVGHPAGQPGRLFYPAIQLAFLTVVLWLAAAVAPARAAYESEMAAFAAQDAANPPPDDVIVFVGSSTITGWKTLKTDFPGYPVLNRGFGGSQMNDVLEHFAQVITPYRAPLLVLYEGDNDIFAGETPEAVFAECLAFVNRVDAELPGTDIVIISVKPSPSRASVMPAMAALNTKLRDLCAARPNLRFADTFTPMLNASGQPRPELFGSDMLHLNAAGYVLWKEVLSPFLAAAPFTPKPADTTPPRLLSGTGRAGNIIELTFSERLDPASANTAAAYAVNAGAPAVTSATLSPDGRVVTLQLAESVTGSVTVRVTGVRDSAGNIIAADSQITLTISAPPTAGMLFDFGSTGLTTDAADDSVNAWNNVTESVGASDTGVLSNLVTTDNQRTSAALRMIRRFNGANTNGTTAFATFPADSTSDSLFGNTEIFNSQSNIFPAFRLTGLEPGKPYDFTFYASRTGVSDNRETVYTLVGAATVTARLQPAGNINRTAEAKAVRASDSGEISISLAPGPANTNGNHFTYLGVLRVSPAPPLTMLPPALRDGRIHLDWTGTGLLEHADSLTGPWSVIQPAPVPPYSELLHPAGRRFFRLREAGP